MNKRDYIIRKFLQRHLIFYRFIKFTHLNKVYIYYLKENREFKKYCDIIYSKGINELIVEISGIKLKLNAASTHDLQFGFLKEKGKIYEPEVTAYLKNNVKEGITFVDVGANNGYFSLLVAGLCHKSCKIFAFEPTPDTYNRLIENIKLNNYENTIIAYNFALGSHSYETFLNISEEENGLNSLLEINNVKNKIFVEVKNLDSIIRDQRVDIMKIDVEGFEEEVLKGSINTIMLNPSIKIIFEHNQSLIKKGNDNGFSFLKQLNFNIYLIEPDLDEKGYRLIKINNLQELPSLCNLLATKI